MRILIVHLTLLTTQVDKRGRKHAERNQAADRAARHCACGNACGAAVVTYAVIGPPGPVRRRRARRRRRRRRRAGRGRRRRARRRRAGRGRRRRRARRRRRRRRARRGRRWRRARRGRRWRPPVPVRQRRRRARRRWCCSTAHHYLRKHMQVLLLSQQSGYTRAAPLYHYTTIIPLCIARNTAAGTWSTAASPEKEDPRVYSNAKDDEKSCDTLASLHASPWLPLMLHASCPAA